ncbi:MAG: FKBP-type peptidyl-prolyl cis-trans isomerase [Streptosporangiaceae bacterium]|nr:FKBP-type peptidyl-prolyl cis-trans isomerase [Streptosporangiaceae bacterium]MBV9857464.1 FKBP-type peptidyl-prolyl cis-trans isomerase [Streptosporangiaceae bacterium]
MRRAHALLIVPLLATTAAAAVSGCSSSSSSSPSSGASASVMATGKFGAAPKVTIPAQAAGSSLTVKTLIQGNGAGLTTTDDFLGNYVVYDWSGSTHKLLVSTYTSKPAVFSGKLLTGLEDAVIGKKVGSRVLAVIPPKDGFGVQGNSQAGIKGTDTLVFVIDLLQRFGNTATGASVSSGGGSLPTVANTGTSPTVKVPSSTPPKNLIAETLIKGTGPAVTKGQYLVVQYTGVNWRTGQVFDSSWSHGAPTAFTIGAGQLIKGWDDGLVGKTVGSRVLLVIPPKEGYGSNGQAQAGIKGTDTLVFVVDILAAR